MSKAVCCKFLCELGDDKRQKKVNGRTYWKNHVVLNQVKLLTLTGGALLVETEQITAHIDVPA